MINAAEVLLDRSAADDAERARNRAQRYKPPKGVQSEPSRRQPGRMDRSQALRMAAELADEDAELTRGRRAAPPIV